MSGLTEPSDSSSESQISPEPGAAENREIRENLDNLPEDQELSNNLVIDTKHDSEPEDLSQTDSEESDQRSPKLEFTPVNGENNIQVKKS